MLTEMQIYKKITPNLDFSLISPSVTAEVNFGVCAPLCSLPDEKDSAIEFVARTFQNSYKLFLDDLRDLEYIHPEDPSEWIVVRSSSEAIKYIRYNGLPTFIAFDHDLGTDDTAKIFAKAMIKMYPYGPVPDYSIHSSNPPGREWLDSYMDSWKRSFEP